jgi:ribosomal protein L13
MISRKKERSPLLTQFQTLDVTSWHTQWPGGLKQRTAKEMLQRNPTEILKRAVAQMLPKNRMGTSNLRKLFVTQFQFQFRFQFEFQF